MKDTEVTVLIKALKYTRVSCYTVTIHNQTSNIKTHTTKLAIQCSCVKKKVSLESIDK